MPSKRVSLKGKGADLFFGDYSPPTALTADAELAKPDAPIATQAESEPEGSHTDNTPATKSRPNQGAVNTVSAPDEASGDMSIESSTQTQPAPRRTRKSASNGDSTLASSDASTVEAIRKVVKATGREVSFVRLSPEEKARLADIVYTYKRQGVKTSENEINRIAINLLLSDYDTNGEASTLSRVLAALNA